MRIPNQLLIYTALTSLFIMVPGPSAGQPLTGAPAAPEYKYSTPMPPGVAAPSTMETRLGTLNFI